MQVAIDPEASKAAPEADEPGDARHRRIRLPSTNNLRIRPAHPALSAMAIPTLASRHIPAHLGGARRFLSSFHRKNADRRRRALISSRFVEFFGHDRHQQRARGPNSTLKGTRNDHEYSLVEVLHEAIDADVEVVLLADRGFGDHKLYEFLESLGWDFVIRFRGRIALRNAAGETRAAEEWVPVNGRATMLRKVCVTDDRAEVAAVVVVRAPKMKEAWCLATTLAKRKASEVVKLYGKRFTIEETFRDEKNLHFGMGLSATHIRDASRRDRLLLLAAIAHALLTLLGAASEEAGLDRYLKVNTVKRRTHSLYRQGLYWYDCIPTGGYPLRTRHAAWTLAV
jgi:Transposase DDE domain